MMSRSATQSASARCATRGVLRDALQHGELTLHGGQGTWPQLASQAWPQGSNAMQGFVQLLSLCCGSSVWHLRARVSPALQSSHACGPRWARQDVRRAHGQW